MSRLILDLLINFNLSSITWREILFPNLSPTSDQERKSNTIFLSGFKRCSTFFNDNSYTVEVHMAFLGFKDKESPLFTASSIGTDADGI